MEATDINGVSLAVGDMVAFSDAGRGGPVHTGIIQKIDDDDEYYGVFRVHIFDDRSHRMNYRWASDTLCINGLTVAN